jgi:hypothetical protein
MLRAVLFGAGWTFAIYPIAFLLLPGFLLTTNQAWVIGTCAALASALAFWTATRLPATSSWPIAIAGWILVPIVVGFVL